VTTRRDLLVLLRAHPGITVSELGRELRLTGMGVRRHLEALAADRLVVRQAPARGGRGRPATGWRLTAAGLELFPRRYDAFAIELLEDVLDEHGPDGVTALLARRTRRLAGEYESHLDGALGLRERVALIARVRDDEGYEADSSSCPDGSFLLTESNCAVHHVAERCSAVCSHELDLLRELMGPDVEVTRTKHIFAGDTECTYRVRSAATTPAAPA